MTLLQQLDALKAKYNEPKAAHEDTLDAALVLRIFESIAVALDAHQLRMNGLGETVLKMEERIGKLPEKVPYRNSEAH